MLSFILTFTLKCKFEWLKSKNLDFSIILDPIKNRATGGHVAWGLTIVIKKHFKLSRCVDAGQVDFSLLSRGSNFRIKFRIRLNIILVVEFQIVFSWFFDLSIFFIIKCWNLIPFKFYQNRIEYNDTSVFMLGCKCL